LENSNYRELIESLTKDNEAKTYQMSVVRLVAEAIVRNLNEPDYFSQVCSSFANIFKASICAFFWLRHREPSGWILDSWANRYGSFSPVTDFIPRSRAGILDWVEEQIKPFYVEEVEDEEIIKIWGSDALQKVRLAALPIKGDDDHIGAFTLIDPVIRLSHKKTNRLLDTIGGLVLAGARNRMLYTRLLNSEEEFKDLFENSSDMVVSVFPEGLIKDCNRMFKEKLKIQCDPRGDHIENLLKEDGGDSFYSSWLRLIEGQAVNNIDMNVKSGDGGLLELELSGNVRLRQDGGIAVVRLYMHDVTEKRRGEREKLEMEMRMKLMRQRELSQLGLYVSGIVHNLQNPVHVAMGHLEILKLKGMELPGLEAIEQSTRNITEIINNLLDKVRRERNTKRVNINLNELLNCELTFLNANAYFKNQVEKRYEFDKKLPPVKGIYGDFSQAIMNIVYNALDAMRNSPRKVLGIRTEYREKSGDIVVAISDTGGGIPEDVRDRIFTPFFTTKNSEEDEQAELISGSGLGLSSSLSLIEPYGGKIHFDTKSGEGTTFFITLPVEQVD